MVKRESKAGKAGKLTLSDIGEIGVVLFLLERGLLASPAEAEALGASTKAKILLTRILAGHPV